ncbi:MAG: sortase [Oscillospiraceae bacterium]
MKNKKNIVVLITMLLGIGLIGYYFHVNYWGEIKRGSYTPTVITQEQKKQYSVELVRQAEFEPLSAEEIEKRKKELSGLGEEELLLKIPSIEVETKVLKGTSDANLKKAVALYENSDIPEKGNRNVCIAGHRDIYGAEFYNIDKIKEGDRFYLFRGNKVFVYNYIETVIVEKDNWDMLSRQGKSLITLTSCHPLRTSQQRIIATGVLSEIWTEK